ncbi:MAG: UvrD-helicase domain-containing protein [Clostridia bacterium]|nr:UvrD-helicase domain-containing protein [Clostridia bacterium]
MRQIISREKIDAQFERMNEMQKAAVMHTEGPLLILAGAGSGKTTVLISRIANILASGLCYPSEILAITFTNKAAKELVSRIENLLGEDGDGVWASTFHSFCAKVLRRNIEKIGYSNDFSIFDTDDSLKVIKLCQKELGIDPQVLAPRAALSRISRCKDVEVSPANYTAYFGNDTYNNDICKIYESYEKKLHQSNALDFDDIILKTVKLFEQCPEVLDYYSSKFKYIMVDEYQDTNPLQFKLIYMLQSVNKNLCVVGDDDQSIYKFRGATIENILSFEKHFKNARVIRLEQNYRSTGNILNAANNVISNNTERKGKTLWTASGEGEPIYENRLDDEYQESLFVADTVLNGVGTEDLHYNDFAVLYRTNAQSSTVEQMFVKSGIPYKIIGGMRFYERKEIKDILAYVYLIHNTADDLRLMRVINEPKRKIGQATVDMLREIAVGSNVSMFDIAEHSEFYSELSRSVTKLKEFTEIINSVRAVKDKISISELIKEIAVKSGYIAMLEQENTDEAKDRINNIAELVSTAALFEEQSEEPTLAAFLEEISLMTDIDNLDEGDDRVVLMTLHSAKGLEFDNVFIVGAEEGLFPSQRCIESEAELEEERRLMYVGITRARKRLYITHTKRRTLFGNTKYNMPSKFIKEIPSEIIKCLYNKNAQPPMTTSVPGYEFGRSGKVQTKKIDLNKPSVQIRKPSPAAAAPVIDFEVGERVSHKTFGEGVLLSKKPMGGDVLLEVKFDKVGTKKIMANFAKLTKA